MKTQALNSRDVRYQNTRPYFFPTPFCCPKYLIRVFTNLSNNDLDLRVSKCHSRNHLRPITAFWACSASSSRAEIFATVLRGEIERPDSV